MTIETQNVPKATQKHYKENFNDYKMTTKRHKISPEKEYDYHMTAKGHRKNKNSHKKKYKETLNAWRKGEKQ